MKRIFHPYDKWECYFHGLYNEQTEGREERVQQSIQLLRNPLRLEMFMDIVSDEWKHSCEVYFSHKGYNRRAWLGQAACCYSHKAGESETREAWRFLTDEEMEKANTVADKVIHNWERRYKEHEKISRKKCLTSC